jgi:hypothetical protein
VPLRTVHTRLNRALHRLREELDRASGGDRKSWLHALIPIAREPGGWSTAAIGAFVMDAKLKVGLTLVVVAGVCSTIVLWPRDGASSAPGSAVAAHETEMTAKNEKRATEPLQEVPTKPERSTVASDAHSAPSAPAAVVETPPKLHGRVIDVERAAVADVHVRWFASGAGASGTIEAVTDSGGRFELTDPQAPGRVDVVGTQWTSLFRPDFQNAPDAREIVIVVARSIKIGGIVVDAQHKPIASATVAAPVQYGLRSRFDAILDASSTVEHSAKTDASGRFELAGVPAYPGAILRTEHATHAPDERAVPAGDDLTLQIELVTLDQGDTSVSGIVVDPAGLPVEGARVALGNSTTKSGAGGAFAFDVRAVIAEHLASEPEEEPTRLCAIQPGYLPAVVERPKSGAWPKPLILRLGGAPLVIDGHVVDADGKPVANAEVWTSDETPFGYVELEGGEMSVRYAANVEGILRGDTHARRLRTDAGGSFALTGLMNHDYRVHVLDVKHLRATTATLAAGTRNVDIRLPREPAHERVAGRVTSLSGEPIAGLQVILLRRSVGVEGLELDRVESAPHTTDAEGRFVFEDIARALTSIQVRGPDLSLGGFEKPIGPKEDVQHLELAVPMTVHVQVETDKSAGFDHLQILDQDGTALEAGVFHGNTAYAMRDVPLKEGRSEVFTVSETGKTIVLYTKGAETLRKPVKLVRGEINAIQL